MLSHKSDYPINLAYDDVSACDQWTILGRDKRDVVLTNSETRCPARSSLARCPSDDPGGKLPRPVDASAHLFNRRDEYEPIWIRHLRPVHFSHSTQLAKAKLPVQFAAGRLATIERRGRTTPGGAIVLQIASIDESQKQITSADTCGGRIDFCLAMMFAAWVRLSWMST